MERSRKAAQNAQIVVHLMAKGEGRMDEGLEANGTVIDVLNKIDLQPSEDRHQIIAISAKRGKIDPLKKELVRVARAGMENQAVMLSNARHYEAVCRAHEAILRVQQGMAEGLSGELLSLDLQDCLNALGEVTGQITNQEVLTNIFSKFCIGK